MISILCALALMQAQDTAALHRAAAAVRPGHFIRVELFGGQRLTGAFQTVGGDAITISDSLQQTRIPLTGVSRFWQRRRAIPAGAAVGGALGAGAGAFLGLIVAAVCETENCPSMPRGAIVGGLLGAGFGAGAGAIVGAAIPRWSERYRYRGPLTADSPAPETVQGIAPDAAAPPRRTGEFTVMGVAGFGGLEFDDAFFGTSYRHGLLAGAEAGLAFRAGRFALGPEGSLMKGEQSLWTLGGMIRYSLRDEQEQGAIPHVLAGLGPHSWKAGTAQSTALTLSAGGGVTTSTGWRFEAKVHQSVQNDFQQPFMLSIGVGRRFIW